MALSVLRINPGTLLWGLWDSEINNFIATGTSEEMYGLKNRLEKQEREEDYKAFFRKLKAERLDVLIKGGMSPREANRILKKKYPYLFHKGNR